MSKNCTPNCKVLVCKWLFKGSGVTYKSILLLRCEICKWALSRTTQIVSIIGVIALSIVSFFRSVVTMCDINKKFLILAILPYSLTGACGQSPAPFAGVA